MSKAFFRAGVGAVVIDDARRILVMKRKGVRDGSWQLPQGGIEDGEAPLDALHRELREETGLRRGAVEVLQDIGGWLVYELPADYRNAKVGWGQAQRWFLCRLTGPRSLVVPDQVEFTQADWVTAAVMIARCVAFRVPVYRRLVEEFAL